MLPFEVMGENVIFYLQSQKITFSPITSKGSILGCFVVHNSYINVLVAVILRPSKSH